MNEPLPPEDALLRAARALREASEARRDGSPAQRGRILAQVHAHRQSAERRAAAGLALSAVLVTSTAIAAATGTLPKVVAAVQRAVGLAPAEAPVAPASVQSVAATPSNAKRTRPADQVPPSSEPAADAQPAPPEPPTPEPPQPEPPVVEPPALQVLEPPPADPARSAKPRATSPRPVPAKPAVPDPVPPNDPQPAAAQPAPPPVAPAPPHDETLALFRSAQALQFRDKAYAKALAGWEAYLRAAPAGALAPEARWNRAVCLLRLGRKAEARIALEPFAQGMEGGYRQAEAARLMAAMQEGEP
ncbi:MAG: hypothetical protein FJ100_06660 [Deltaproteobacteria bacterium]|nr:hypothetical protein [Deltaproteobacteria bacterium]